MIAIPATAVIKPLTFLARFGQTDIQRIQEIPLLLTVIRGLLLSIAPAGHLSAHNLQAVHEVPAFGIIPAPAFLYDLFPGILDSESSFSSAFFKI